MLLTRLSTNLLSRSIRGVARTLAIVALLFVSQLIVGADAFAQGGVTQIIGSIGCSPCRLMKQNLGLDPGYFGPARLNGQNVNFVNGAADDYTGPELTQYPTVITADDKIVTNLEEINKIEEGLNEKKQPAQPPPPKEGGTGHAVIQPPPQPKNSEQPENRRVCGPNGCSGSGGGGRGGGLGGRGGFGSGGGGGGLLGGLGGGGIGQALFGLGLAQTIQQLMGGRGQGGLGGGLGGGGFGGGGGGFGGDRRDGGFGGDRRDRRGAGGCSGGVCPNN